MQTAGGGGGSSEDVVQRAFIALSAESVVPRNPPAWLYATSRNLAINERKQYQRRQRQFTQADFKKMSEEEIVMRWVLAETARVNGEIELAFSLPPSVALPRLLRLEKDIAAQMKRTGAPQSVVPREADDHLPGVPSV